MTNQAQQNIQANTQQNEQTQTNQQSATVQQQAPKQDQTVGHQQAETFFNSQTQPPVPAQNVSTQAGQQQQAPAFKPIQIGNQIFSNQDELTAYASELHTDKFRQEQVQKEQQNKQPQPQQPIQPGQSQNLQYMLYHEPDKFVQTVFDTAYNAGVQATTQAQQETKFWSDFYSQNPDLRRIEGEIRRYVNENLNQGEDLAKKTPQDASKIIADYGRNVFQSIKGTETTKQQLSSGPATTLGTSNAPLEGAPEQPRKIVNMVDQIRAMQAKRRKGRAG